MTEDVTPRFGFPYLYAGQAQKEVFHNEALILADLLVQAYAKSADQMVPPQTPAPGECWIVGDAPSGDWAGWAGALACWTHGGWRFVSPRPGMRVRVEDQGLDYRSEEHTSELQSLMRISYAVFCLKKKKL